MQNDNPFKIKRKAQIQTKECQLVGAYVPRPLAEQLALWAIYYQIPKADIIRTALTTALPADKGVAYMLSVLADKAHKGWKARNKAHTEKISSKQLAEHFTKYKKELRKTLQRRGLPDHLITEIIQGLNKKAGFD